MLQATAVPVYCQYTRYTNGHRCFPVARPQCENPHSWMVQHGDGLYLASACASELIFRTLIVTQASRLPV